MKQAWLGFAAALLASPALADHGESPRPNGAELAACRRAADQPVCLLKLLGRIPAHQPYAANLQIGYAPEVLAAIGPEPVDPVTGHFSARLAVPSRAVVLALIADHAGKPPSEALAPIRNIALDPMWGPDRRKQAETEAAEERIRAYRILWDAGRSDTNLPPERRPSERLRQAALDAWQADLAMAGKEGEAGDLAEALLQTGERRRAEMIIASADVSDLDRVSFLVKAGKFDDAVRFLRRMKPSSDPTSALELALSRTLILTEAVKAGRKDVALEIARAQLEAWFAEVADPSRRGPAHSGADIASDLVLIAQVAPREEAVRLAERMDAAARSTPPLAAAASAWAAAHAWTRLGEPERAQAVLHLWPAADLPDLKACLSGLLKIAPECQKSPSVALAILSKTAPLDASWERLSPMTALIMDRPEPTRSWADVEAEMAKVQAVADRFGVLQGCARTGLEAQPVSVTAECARRLATASAPPDPVPLPKGRLSYGERRLDGALSAAREAARSHDLKTMHEMLDLSFKLAERVPDEEVNQIMSVEEIAIAELREQGRL